MARRKRQEPHYLYKQKKYGRISKYGITNNPSRRYGENVRDGYGESMEILGSSYSRPRVRRAESYKIRSYARRYGRRPWGNRTR